MDHLLLPRISSFFSIRFPFISVVFQSSRFFLLLGDKNVKGQVLKGLVDEESLMAHLLKCFAEMVEKSNTEKLNDLTELAKDFAISIADVEATPMYDLDEIAIEVSKKYAMVFQVGTNKWNYGWDSDNKFAEDLINYINVIDVCNKAQAPTS